MLPINGHCLTCHAPIDAGTYGLRRYCRPTCPGMIPRQGYRSIAELLEAITPIITEMRVNLEKIVPIAERVMREFNESLRVYNGIAAMLPIIEPKKNKWKR